jgi:hypothetical protein
LVTDKHVSLERLFECGVLDLFVFNKVGDMIAFLCGFSTFVQIIADVCALPIAKLSSTSVVKQVFESIEYFEKETLFVDVLAFFLSRFPDASNFHCLFSIKPGIALRICHSTFVLSEKSTQGFANSGGIAWLFDLCRNDDVNRDVLIELVSVVVTHSDVARIEQEINKLESSHPLFGMPTESIERIVYGMDKSIHRPIRVASLFPYLPQPSSVDPYNAYVIGSRCLDTIMNKTIDISRVSMLNDVANRYLKSKDAVRLMQNLRNLEIYVNKAYDHFPLFQFYPGIVELKFNVPTVAISFWFKFSEFIRSSRVFFHNVQFRWQLTMRNYVLKLIFKKRVWR